VYRFSNSQKYQAKISANGRSYSLGYFDTAEAAARAFYGYFCQTVGHLVWSQEKQKAGRNFKNTFQHHA